MHKILFTTMSQCIFPAAWLLKANTIIFEISKSLQQMMQIALHLEDDLASHKENQVSHNQLILKMYESLLLHNSPLLDIKNNAII